MAGQYNMNFNLHYLLLVIIISALPLTADITIATVGPMSGPYASIGEQMKQGAAMAVKHINAQRRCVGRKTGFRCAG